MKRIKSVGGAICIILCLGQGDFSGQEDTVKFTQPILITSAGQSAEVQLASVLAKRAGLDFTLVKLARSQDIKNAKTLLLSLGASLKGLGAAGLDEIQERSRVKELIQAAQAKNIPILCVHLGGEARRGTLSDEFITSFLPFAQQAIIVKSGNKDGLFENICKEHQIFLIQVDKVVDAVKPLKEIFR